MKAEHRQHVEQHHPGLLQNALTKLPTARTREQIRRLAKVLASGLTEEYARKPDETADLMSAAVELSEVDVIFLQQMDRNDRFRPGGPELASIDEANDEWTFDVVRPHIEDIDHSGGQSIARKLERFGLIEEVERRSSKVGPNETPFRLLRKGAHFLRFVRNYEAS